MADRIAALAGAAVTGRSAHSPRLLVTLDGPAGAGKTTLADDVWPLLARTGTTAEIVHLDDLYDGWAGLDETLTAHLASWIVLPLRDGLPVRHPVYDWHAGRYTQWRDVPDSDVLLLEGVGAGQPVTAAAAALRVWVTAPPEVCRQRAIARDGGSTRDHWGTWVARQEAHFAWSGAREAAHLVIAG